jgi:2,3-bisphosphoglycerate-independent phosphoglycerate mutase
VKTILIIGDGMADRPLKRLGWRTPLEASDKPNLDRVAKTGVCGLIDPIAPGVPPGSDTSHLALFGYDPYIHYQGRGAFEALGGGIEVRRGDISFRGNFASVDERMVVVDRRAARINQGSEELALAIDGLRLEAFPDVEVIVKHTVEHRLALVLRGPRLSRMVSDSDPGKEGAPVKKVTHLDESYEALRTASIVNTLSSEFHRILENHEVNAKRREKGLPPANAVLLRGAGTLPEVHPISETYGVRALAVAAGALYRGIAKCVGMEVVEAKGATGDYGTDTLSKAKTVIERLPQYDLVFIHVKATDNAAHDGDHGKKIMMIEKIDALVGHLLDNTDPEETFITVTADHTTSTELREHTGDPVPLAITGPGVRRDAVDRFSEVDCAHGGLGRIRGVSLMPILMDLAGRAKKFGE